MSFSIPSGFGVIPQTWKQSELDAYYPDLWTVVQHCGATLINDSVRRWVADGCAERGLKHYMSYTPPPYDLYNLPPMFLSNAAMKTHLDQYNIAQYRNHPGVFGHILAGEPGGATPAGFDPRSPPQEALNLIEVCRFGCDYIRSLDPTHPVTVALNPAGAHVYDAGGLWIEKRKAWINRFIDFCDILDYHLYLFGDTAGTEWYRNPSLWQNRLVRMLDEVLIPSCKGKPIIVGETGQPTEDYLSWNGSIAQYTEQNQVDYFRWYGEETRKRNIFTIVYKLLDGPGATHLFGLYRSQIEGGMNKPKLAAGLLNDYLSINGAPPTQKYYFDHWEINGVTSKDNPLQMTIPSDVHLSAVYVETPTPPTATLALPLLLLAVAIVLKEIL